MYFRFPLKTAQFTGEFFNKTVGEACQIGLRSLILSCGLYCANTICSAIYLPLIGEAWQNKISEIFNWRVT
jgi:hypothetical protein